MVKYSRSELSGGMLERAQRRADTEYEKAVAKWEKGKPVPVKILTRRSRKPQIVKRAKRVKKR